jgi:GSCFA family protein
MTNPYDDLPDESFWRLGVAAVEPEDIDPIIDVPFVITPTDRVATAGSCFAQHLSRAIAKRGFNYFVAETTPGSVGAVDENYGVFSARYGNVYTAVQMCQLFERAYGLFAPRDDVWPTSEGRFVDPFRPRIQAGGFASIDHMQADRDVHFASCRQMFEECDVFVFTLGLTECWRADADGAVVPLTPGVVGEPSAESAYSFCNLSMAETSAALLAFIDGLRTVNPRVRIVLTVSPVALVATYERRHVLVANGYSKAVLRVVADEVSRAREAVSYFPSFDLLQSPATAGRFLAPDRRQVSDTAVERVMEVFARHYLSAESASQPTWVAPVARRDHDGTIDVADLTSLQGVICDEELMGR